MKAIFEDFAVGGPLHAHRAEDLPQVRQGLPDERAGGIRPRGSHLPPPRRVRERVGGPQASSRPRHLLLRNQAAAGRFQPSQSTTAPPMTRSRSRPFSHGSSSVNIRPALHGMRVMSVPQNKRSGPKASKIWRR